MDYRKEESRYKKDRKQVTRARRIVASGAPQTIVFAADVRRFWAIAQPFEPTLAVYLGSIANRDAD